LKNHILLPGETLDSVAKRHGVTSMQIYSHRYNSDLRKKRARPQDAAPGDTVYIVGTNILEFWSLTTMTKI
jgi:transposase-like protein